MLVLVPIRFVGIASFYGRALPPFSAKDYSLDSLPPASYAPVMFDTIKSGITTATDKLTHLRRFL